MKTIKCLCNNCEEIVKVKEDNRVCPYCGGKLRKSDIITTKTKLRNKSWRVFSAYIRTRDCLNTTGSIKEGKCYTCGSLFEFKDLQAGHMIGGRTYDVLFDENLVNAQCYKCNMHKNGEQGIFLIKKMEELISDGMTTEDAFEEVKSWYDREKSVLEIEDLASIYFEYKRKLEELNAQYLGEQ